MGRLGFPPWKKLIKDFNKSSSSKVQCLSQSSPEEHLPTIQHRLLERANLPTLAVHIQRLGQSNGPTGNRLKPWNQFLGLSFHAGSTADNQLNQLKITGTALRSVVILSSKLFPFTVADRYAVAGVILIFPCSSKLEDLLNLHVYTKQLQISQNVHYLL
jgi:hypothetical protein